MKKIIIVSFFSALFLFTGCEQKKFTVPKLTGRIVDKTSTLSNSEIKELENSIKNFEKKTKGQFAVCIVPHIVGETVESASMKVAESWQIGQKEKDNGILFFLSMREREFRIEIGYGFESKLNDAKTGKIGRLAISHFKKKRWKEGIDSIIVNCGNVISGDKKSAFLQEEKLLIPDWLALIIVLFIIMLFVFGFGSMGSVLTSNHRYEDFEDDFKDNNRGGFGGGGGGFGGGGFSGKF